LGGVYSTHCSDENANVILVGKPEEKRLSRRWEYNVKMNLKQLGCEGVDWIKLAQNRVHWTR